MRQLLTYYTVLFFCCAGVAQQTAIFSQYTFNKAGVNPAASGSDINQKYNYVFGINRQWTGFENAPKQNFVNFSMTLRPSRSYHYWQNVGVYVDATENGIMTNNGVYANYTLHLLLRKNLVASFGIYAGIRSYFISSGTLDKQDPVFQKSNFKTLMYPDIIPGFRLSNKKYFMDIAVRQITINKLKDFQGHQIGGPSKLNPAVFFSVGKKMPLSDAFLFMPSLALNTSILHNPAVDVNAMLYYANRMGAGLALRNLSFASIIYQLRIFSNIAVGLSYSYSLNTARYAAPNSFEIMIGVTPIGMSSKTTGKHSVARCPGLDF